jgi:hypothetical protein
MLRRASWALAGMTLWLLWPAGADAATKPAATTGAAANVAQTTATLTGTVNPHGAATTYLFQIGTTSVYGVNTATTAAGAGTAGRHVTAPVGGLAPFTTYHYRLVARNSKGLTKGRDRTFKTLRQPLGVSLVATPNPVRFGRPVTLSGVLSGTNNGNREVAVQLNAFPYTHPFAQYGNPLLTLSNGAFSYTLPGLGFNSQFRVQMPNRPGVISPIVAVGVSPLVTVHVRRLHRALRFSGSVRPALIGLVFVQKRRHGHWANIARTAPRGGGKRSTYKRRVRQTRGGRYRVVVVTSGQYSPGGSRTVRARPR